jgi:hypothetical protein
MDVVLMLSYKLQHDIKYFNENVTESSMMKQR